jgi:hypothetical protein
VVWERQTGQPFLRQKALRGKTRGKSLRSRLQKAQARPELQDGFGFVAHANSVRSLFIAARIAA